MAPKRVAKVASKPGSKKSAPVPRTVNPKSNGFTMRQGTRRSGLGASKLLEWCVFFWIHFAPQHSRTKPWRIQITGQVPFFWLLFCFVKKLYFCFFCPDQEVQRAHLRGRQAPPGYPEDGLLRLVFFYLDRWELFDAPACDPFHASFGAVHSAGSFHFLSGASW